jgi:hypothetical protein
MTFGNPVGEQKMLERVRVHGITDKSKVAQAAQQLSDEDDTENQLDKRILQYGYELEVT